MEKLKNRFKENSIQNNPNKENNEVFIPSPLNDKKPLRPKSKQLKLTPLDPKLYRINFEDFEGATIPKECAGCEIVFKCRGGVFDRRILWYGTLAERDPYCPKRYGFPLPERKFFIPEHGRISVHDDYLPTLFFGNKGKLE